MNNHPKFTESHDSAARSVGYEGAREIREPVWMHCGSCGKTFDWNKSRKALTAVCTYCDAFDGVDGINHTRVAEFPSEQSTDNASTGVE